MNHKTVEKLVFTVCTVMVGAGAWIGWKEAQDMRAKIELPKERSR